MPAFLDWLVRADQELFISINRALHSIDSGEFKAVMRYVNQFGSAYTSLVVAVVVLALSQTARVRARLLGELVTTNVLVAAVIRGIKVRRLVVLVFLHFTGTILRAIVRTIIE